VCTTLDRAQAGGPDTPSYLLFTGIELWRYGAFLYGGALWSPDGLDADGFTLKVLLNGGKYSYFSGGLQQTIGGTLASAAALPGWRFTRDGLTVSLFLGPVVQDYRLTPVDPGSRLHGFYVGGEFAADIWYQPSPRTLATVSGGITSIDATGYLRTSFGFRVFQPAFIGPEIQEYWTGNYQELQFGAHMTGLHLNGLEWLVGSGWALTSDHRWGPYFHVGVNARY